MKIRILGCSGGLGPGRRTTSFLVDDELLIDAGSGLEQLDMEQLLRIRHVLITHAHLDHILGLPLMLGTIYERHQVPVRVHALAEVLTALQQHVFNWTLWPDFTCLPRDKPILELVPVEMDRSHRVGEYEVVPLPVTHPTPSAGFWVKGAEGSSFAFTGDSGFHPPFWQRLNVYRPQLVIADVSFVADSADLAVDSGHMVVDQLGQVMAMLEYQPEIRATHFKVGQEERLVRLLEQFKYEESGVAVRPLRQGEEFDLLLPDPPAPPLAGC